MCAISTIQDHAGNLDWTTTIITWWVDVMRCEVIAVTCFHLTTWQSLAQLVQLSESNSWVCTMICHVKGFSKNISIQYDLYWFQFPPCQPTWGNLSRHHSHSVERERVNQRPSERSRPSRWVASVPKAYGDTVFLLRFHWFAMNVPPNRIAGKLSTLPLQGGVYVMFSSQPIVWYFLWYFLVIFIPGTFIANPDPIHLFVRSRIDCRFQFPIQYA